MSHAAASGAPAELTTEPLIPRVAHRAVGAAVLLAAVEAIGTTSSVLSVPTSAQKSRRGEALTASATVRHEHRYQRDQMIGAFRLRLGWENAALSGSLDADPGLCGIRLRTLMPTACMLRTCVAARRL